MRRQSTITTATTLERTGWQAFGARLVLTPATKGMGGAVAKAESIVADLGENAFMLQQFNNPDNPKVGFRCKRRSWSRPDEKHVSCLIEVRAVVVVVLMEGRNCNSSVCVWCVGGR